MEGNPHAPSTVMTLRNVKPGVKLHFYAAGSNTPAQVEITSEPFPRFRMDARGRLPAVKVLCGGIDDVWFLEEMGIIPDRHGVWSRNFCVRVRAR